jgi:hypothetical protein
MPNLDGPVTPEPSAQRRAWNLALVWSIVGLAGWLAFDLTAEPAVAAAILCGRFGWDDLLTAIWLRRRDPDRARGRTCSWFCLASGTMKIFFSACVLTALIAEVVTFIEARQPQPNPNALMPEAIWGPLLLMAGATPLVALLGLTGVFSARIHGVRVWIDGSLNRSRRVGIWPPQFPEPFAANRHKGAPVAMLALPAVVAVGCLTGALILMIVGFDGICAVVLIAGPLYVSYGPGRPSGGLFARFPAECWDTRNSVSRGTSATYNG